MNSSNLFSVRLSLSGLMGLALPSYCISCKLSLSNPQELGNHCLCQGCIRNLPWLAKQCPQCATSMATNSLCADCQLQPPPFRRCLAAFEYRYPVDKMIQRIKVDRHAPELQQLSKLLAQTISTGYRTTDKPRILIPVPLHWRKQMLRGFNQSHSIAQILSENLSDVRIQANSCLRVSHGRPQHLQAKRQRLSGMRGAFRAQQNPQLSGQAVALIDDVITTGATASAAARCLLDAGAHSVDIWCIARTGWHIDAG